MTFFCEHAVLTALLQLLSIFGNIYFEVDGQFYFKSDICRYENYFRDGAIWMSKSMSRRYLPDEWLLSMLLASNIRLSHIVGQHRN